MSVRDQINMTVCTACDSMSSICGNDRGNVDMLMVQKSCDHQLRLEVGSFCRYLPGFIHPRWCRISSINSMT